MALVAIAPASRDVESKAAAMNDVDPATNVRRFMVDAGTTGNEEGGMLSNKPRAPGMVKLAERPAG